MATNFSRRAFFVRSASSAAAFVGGSFLGGIASAKVSKSLAMNLTSPQTSVVFLNEARTRKRGDEARRLPEFLLMEQWLLSRHWVGTESHAADAPKGHPAEGAKTISNFYAHPSDENQWAALTVRWKDSSIEVTGFTMENVSDDLAMISNISVDEKQVFAKDPVRIEPIPGSPAEACVSRCYTNEPCDDGTSCRCSQCCFFGPCLGSSFQCLDQGCVAFCCTACQTLGPYAGGICCGACIPACSRPCEGCCWYGCSNVLRVCR